jgi:hypothetical protein
MSGSILWAFGIAGLFIVMEIARAELREWNARRKAAKRGRTLTVKYGIPWR